MWQFLPCPLTITLPLQSYILRSLHHVLRMCLPMHISYFQIPMFGGQRTSIIPLFHCLVSCLFKIEVLFPFFFNLSLATCNPFVRHALPPPSPLLLRSHVDWFLVSAIGKFLLFFRFNGHSINGQWCVSRERERAEDFIYLLEKIVFHLHPSIGIVVVPVRFHQSYHFSDDWSIRNVTIDRICFILNIWNVLCAQSQIFNENKLKNHVIFVLPLYFYWIKMISFLSSLKTL